MTSKLQELDQEWMDAVRALNSRIKTLKEQGIRDAREISQSSYPERKVLEEAYTALEKARNQVVFSARIVAPTYEDAMAIAGWAQPKVIVTYRSGRKIENGLSYALIIRGYLRDHELTAGWDGVDL